MTREAIGLGMISILALIVLLIFLSNRRLRARQEKELAKPAPFEMGDLLATCLYVSTVYQLDPLKRVWAHGLGHRGKVDLVLNANQLGFDRKGEVSFGIPLGQLSQIGSASATIDKAVESNGLLAIHWNLAGQDLLTNLRIVDSALRSKTQLRLLSLLGVENA